MASIRAVQSAQQMRSDLAAPDDAPIDLEAMCDTLGVKVFRSPLEGFSGNLIVAGDNAVIGVSTRHNNVTWQRFTIAHELGHFSLHFDPATSRAAFDTDATLNQWNGDPQEVEANAFAAELLLPSKLIVPRLRQTELTWDLVGEIAEHCGASLRATARKCVESSSEAIAFVVTQGNKYLWSAKSQSFEGRIADGALSPFTTSQPHTGWMACRASEWISWGKGLNLKAEISVASRRADGLNQILTLVWDEDGGVFNPDEDDEDSDENDDSDE